MARPADRHTPQSCPGCERDGEAESQFGNAEVLFDFNKTKGA